MDTKQDFPTIMTRGRVVEGRLDIALEKQGSIFGGRDEKNIMDRKKEESQQQIKMDLMK